MAIEVTWYKNISLRFTTALCQKEKSEFVLRQVLPDRFTLAECAPHFTIISSQKNTEEISFFASKIPTKIVLFPVQKNMLLNLSSGVALNRMKELDLVMERLLLTVRANANQCIASTRSNW